MRGHKYLPLPMDPPGPSTPENSLARRDDYDDDNSLLTGDGGTKRGLQERHLSMIALAGMIGTGLFLSSGKALSQAGPLSVTLGYIVMGTVMTAVAYTSAEMSAFKPVGGGFVRHANMWLDKSSSISTGWNFWYSLAVTMPAEITAAATLLGFWWPNLNTAIPIAVLWVVITMVNLGPIRLYGEFEFYFAFIKIALIIGFIIAGLLLDLGAFRHSERIGFRYWKDPYPLFAPYIFPGATGRFLGFWSVMISAAYAYGNVQIVAIAGAETREPRKAIPKALKRTFFRVTAFYVLSILVISMLVPATEPKLSLPGETAAQSPFVIAFERTGNKVLPSVVNAVIFTSAFSSGNSCTFLASRTLHGLALDGHAPLIFLKLNRFCIPYIAVLFSAAWGAVAFLSVNQGSFQVFLWLVALVTTAGLICASVLCLTYLRFYYALQRQGISRERLPYRGPLQPYLASYALVMNVLVVFFSGWTSFVGGFHVSSFLSNYLNCLIYPILYIGCKIYFRDRLVPVKEMDFLSELDAIEREQESAPLTHLPYSWYDRILNAIF